MAESRSARPQLVWHPTASTAPPYGSGDPTCPFCHGQEHATPDGIEYFASADFGWQVRVVPNLYPTVILKDTPDSEASGPERESAAMSSDGSPAAEGIHEVVIECPEHADDADGPLPTEQLAKVCQVYRARLRSHRTNSRLKAALVFKNAGYEAGASIPHPHSQVLAMSFTPPYLRNEVNQSRHKWKQHGECVYCRLVQECLAGSPRTVAIGEHMVAICPFAPRFAYETWLLPRFHRAAFEDESNHVLDELAYLLHQLIAALQATHPQCSYNYYIHSAPFDTNCEAYYHWHVEVFPRTHRWAGFELGAGCIVNPTSPEFAASLLRGYFREQLCEPDAYARLANQERNTE